MPITPDDIREKEFKRGMRGYDVVEVDEFLDQITEEMEILLQQNHSLQQQLMQAQQQAVAQPQPQRSLSMQQPTVQQQPAPQPVPQMNNEELNERERNVRGMEETLKATLITAQRAADDLVREARLNAESTLESARMQAEQMLDAAEQESANSRRKTQEAVDGMIAHAQAEHDRIVHDAADENERLKEENIKLHEQVNSFRESFFALIEQQIQTLDKSGMFNEAQ